MKSDFGNGIVSPQPENRIETKGESLARSKANRDCQRPLFEVLSPMTTTRMTKLIYTWRHHRRDHVRDRHPVAAAILTGGRQTGKGEETVGAHCLALSRYDPERETSRRDAAVVALSFLLIPGPSPTVTTRKSAHDQIVCDRAKESLAAAISSVPDRALSDPPPVSTTASWAGLRRRLK